MGDCAAGHDHLGEPPPSPWRNAVLIHSRILTLPRTQLRRRARSARRSTGELSPSPRLAPASTLTFLPSSTSQAIPRRGNRDAGHRLRRVPGPARREGLLLRCAKIPVDTSLPPARRRPVSHPPALRVAAGICRSKTVRTPDDGVGPNVDEVRRAIRSARDAASLPCLPTHRILTRAVLHLELGGHGDGERSPKQPRSPRAPPLSSHRRPSRAQLLNTSSNSIFAGDLVEWSLSYSMAQRGDSKRQRAGPRRIGAHASFRLPSHAVDARRSPFTPLRFQASRPPPFQARK